MNAHIGVRSFLLIGLVALVYANSLAGTFHYDDFHSIVHNPHIRELANVPHFFSDPALFSADVDKAMYRPLLLVSYALNYAWGGYGTMGYHLVNIAIHIACALLVWQIGMRMGLASSGAYFSAVLFALHPLASEPVNYISSRSESLASALFLASFYGYIGLGQRKFSTLSLLAATAALLVKSIAFVLPFVLLCYELLWCRQRPRAVRLGPYFIVAVAYLGLISANQFLTTSLQKAPRSISEQLWTQSKALIYYLKLVIMPVGLNVEHAFFPANNVGEPVVFFSLVVLAAIGYCAFRGRGNRAIFWLCWVGLVLGPTLIVPLNVLVNEHRLYLPLVAVSLACGQYWPRLSRGPLRLILYCLLGAIALNTMQRNRVWGDELSLWSDAVSKAPQMPRAQVHWGNALRDRGRWQEARQAYREALRLDPQLLAARTNLANLYFEASQRDAQRAPEYLGAAVEEYQRVLQINPNYAEALNNLGGAYLALARPQEAEVVLLRAQMASPNMVDVHFNLGLLAAQRENYAVAATHFARCIELKEDGAVYREWGHVLVQMGDLPAAADIYRRAVGLDAGDLSSLHNLAEVLLVSGESEFTQGRQTHAAELWREARESLQKVLARDPGNVRAQRRLQQLRERLP